MPHFGDRITTIQPNEYSNYFETSDTLPSEVNRSSWYGPLVQFAEFPHLLCLSIASSSSSSDRGEMPSTRNPGKLSEAVVSICISST